ncbi:MAG: hypothetical protein U1E18_23155 [Brevundimonas sp.]|uniref:hypothetical protein n=1 Tax=Brevundimonas sp. TaxID=1871086 RepID=UPI002ABD05A7|nr:hypothetical protein [Brevundimonas sp.]MDZ4112474.1 hypothetical protein [Brevundimonas sp.]
MSLKILIRTGAVAATALIAALAVTSTASAQSSIRVGQTINGTLTASDPVMEVDGSNYDCYIVSTRAGQTYTIDLESDDFDTFIGMGAGRGCQPPVDEFNDDRSDGDTNSRLTFTSAGGDYFIFANSYEAGESGAYRLSVTEQPSSRASSRFTRPSDPRQRYDFDTLCAGVAVVGLLVLMEQEVSDDDLMVYLEENYELTLTARASGAAIGKTEAEVDDEIASYGAALMTSDELMRDYPPVETRQGCLDASGR